MRWLREHCPRLARARDDYIADLKQKRECRRWLKDEELELERLVAHRELQLLRAGATGDGGYVSRRAYKLDRARERLAHVKDELRRAA